jgi:hypothetical protein
MTAIPKDLLLQQGRLVVALILSHAGLFLVAWTSFRLTKTLSSTAAIIYALMLSTSATPVFGLAVLRPLLGPTSSGAVGLIALAINLTVPPAIILSCSPRFYSAFFTSCTSSVRSRVKPWFAAASRSLPSSFSLRPDISLPKPKAHPCFCSQRWH